MTETYNHQIIEQKWQKYWLKERSFKVEDHPQKPKKYVLDMFPYPSGDGLHVGHLEGYTGSDVISHYYRLKGFAVLHPIGWDAFGLPAENYAIKQNTHPQETTAKNIKNFIRQFQATGISFDWEREINTADPTYYRWTQWMFLQLFKHNLAYQSEAKVNWCEHCQTVLANEQVIDGKCERCEHQVIQKDMKQWFFKITAYAERLLQDLKQLDWPQSIKQSQTNWIGRSEGAELDFIVVTAATSEQLSVKVFTTRPDTIYGATYLVLAPEHELVKQIVTTKQQIEVERYIKQTTTKSELTRSHLEKEKTGVFTGAYAINPATKEQIPIWIADYVLTTYGTGAIMAVPAHDQRDFDFAQRYKLKIQPVIAGFDGKKAYENDGELQNSRSFTGKKSAQVKWDMAKQIGGKKVIRYKLRDWLISRQRYWGAPIPIIHCDHCGVVPVPESDLPVLLPDDVNFRPKGHSPLAESSSFNQVKCPKCGQAKARREYDTMDTFVCSSWYFLRYPNPHLNDHPFDRNTINHWLPVDMYVGGVEHAVLHLLYARFFTKALADFGYLYFTEPFTALRNPGTILGPDHAKMSKSKDNVINPDEVITEYGADALRLHELFMGPFSDEKPWSTKSILGVKRFLDKIFAQSQKTSVIKSDPVLLAALHRTIKKVTEDTEQFHFNTAIAAMMQFINTVGNKSLSIADFSTFILLLFPYAPHLTSEIWQRLGNTNNIYEQSYPRYKTKLIVTKNIEIVIQVNGKVRGRLAVASNIDQAELIAQAKAIANVKQYIGHKPIKKEIVIKQKLVNIVV